MIEHVTPAFVVSCSARAPVIGNISSELDAAHAASVLVVEYLDPVIECGSSLFSIARAALEQVPSKRCRRALYALLLGCLQDAVFLVPRLTLSV